MSPDTALDLLFTAADVALEAKATKLPTVSILAYSGGMMRLPGWGDVMIDLAGLDASSSIALLADHQNAVEAILGQGTASTRNGQLYVTGTLPPVTEAAKKVIDLAKAGFRFQASVGAEVQRFERVATGDTITINGKVVTAEAGFIVIRAAKLREVSILALGADADTSVDIQAKKELAMSETNTSTTNPATTPEQDRITAISAICTGIDGTTYPEVEAKALTENWSLTQTRLAVVDAIRAARPKAPSAHCYSSISDVTPEVLECGQALRCGVNVEKSYKPQVIEAARRNPVNSLIDLARAVCYMNGAPIPSGTNDLLRASMGFTSVGLSGILGNVANKSLLESYNAFPSVARIIAKQLSANDFKSHTGYRLTGDFTFQEVGPNGELKHAGDIDEQSFSYSVSTFGRMIISTAAG